MQRHERNAVSDSALIELGRYKVKMMTLTWPKLLLLWEQLKRFRTLFSDLTRGDLENFIRYVSNQDTFWLEIWCDKELVGIITCDGISKVVDIDAHVLFLDRDVADKVDICKATVAWLFSNFPLQRISVQVPTMYHATIRLVRNLGFKQEGKKRAAVLISGKWVDQYLFGITRQEAMSP